MRKLSNLMLMLAAISALAIAQDPQPIRNFLRVNSDFCTGGQPRLEHLVQLKTDGVKAIINLRVPTEHRAAEEEAKAKELGLRYFNIPVVFADPKEEQVTEFLRITDDPANRPAFIHCTGAIRVGAFWMIRRVLRDGWSIEDAEKEAEKVGLRESPHLNEFARKYIANHKADKPSGASPEAAKQLVAEPLKFGAFTASFDPAGTFKLDGKGWPPMAGSWKVANDEIELSLNGTDICKESGRYRLRTEA